jgi:hypothetical protein
MKKLHWCPVCQKFHVDNSKTVFPYAPDIDYVVSDKICSPCKKKKPSK